MAEGNAIKTPCPDFGSVLSGEMGVSPGRKEGAREGVWELFTVKDLFLSCFQNAFNSS